MSGPAVGPSAPGSGVWIKGLHLDLSFTMVLTSDLGDAQCTYQALGSIQMTASAEERQHVIPTW